MTLRDATDQMAASERRVLIVDDDVDLSESLREILEARGYTVAIAHDIAGAEQAARGLVPQVALLDVNLGPENGLSLITSLKAAFPDLLCVVITARADIEHSIDALRRGAFDYLLKPLHPLETLSRLEKCFDKIALQARAEKAEARSQAKSLFLAMMSHELRTPLNAIIGFAELMQGERFGPLGSSRYREYASDIRQSGAHLLQLINSILDLSRAEAGKLEIQNDVFDIVEVAAECARQMRPAAAEAGLRLELKLPSAPLFFSGDIGKFRQILFNLLSNSMKFTPTGGQVEILVAKDPDSAIRLVVRDTGVGMAPADIPIAMQPFTQLDTSLARRYEGTGLGLPLTASLVELHGGRLILESSLGQGTTATVLFPAVRTLDEGTEQPPRTARLG